MAVKQFRNFRYEKPRYYSFDCAINEPMESIPANFPEWQADNTESQQRSGE
jgi:hypothetical protein